MGAWGYGLYDNDTAMDCFSDYEDYIKVGMDEQTAIQELIKYWYIIDNNSILVIADLQIKNFGKLDDNIKEVVKKAIQEEKDNISEWRNPEERKKIIEEFYSDIKNFL
jgi:hypothetical protein